MLHILGPKRAGKSTLIEPIECDINIYKNDIDIKSDLRARARAPGPNGAGKSTLIKPIQYDINHLQNVYYL